MVGMVTSFDDIPVSEFLEHHGIKGMKWGVRKDRSGHITKNTTLSESVAANLMVNPVSSLTGRGEERYDQTFRRAKRQISKHIGLVNKLPRYRGKNFKNESPLRNEYYAEISSGIEKALNRAAETLPVKIGGFSSNKLALVFDFDVSKTAVPTVYMKETVGAKTRLSAYKKNREDNQQLKSRIDAERAVIKEAKAAAKEAEAEKKAAAKKAKAEKKLVHADDSTFEMELEAEWDSLGHLLSLDLKTQEDKTEALQDTLEHHGIKGMKWGVRRTESQLGHPSKPKPAWLKTKVSSLKKRPLPKDNRSPEQKEPVPGSRDAARSSGVDKAKSSTSGQNGSKPEEKKPVVEVTVQKPILDNNELRSLVERTRLLKELDSLNKPPSPQQVKSAAQELQEKINTIKLEREYKQLTTPKTRGSALRKAGADIATAVLKDSAKVALTAYTTAAMKKGLGTAFKGMGINLAPQETKPNANLKAAVDKIKLERELAKLQKEGKTKG